MAARNPQLHYSPRQVSYLQARDPSFISWNRHGIEKVRCNLEHNFSTCLSCTHESPQPKEEGLSVYLRIKGGVPFGNVYNVQDNVLSCVVPVGSQAAKNSRENNIITRKYTFSRIFGPKSTQEELFDATVREKVFDFINGANSTLLAYGVSGAGKTYTMVGTADNPGIIPRALNYIFGTVRIDPNSRPSFKPLPNGKIELLNGIQKDYELQVRQQILKDPSTHAELHKHKCNFLSMQNTLKVIPVGIIDVFPPISELWVSFVEIYNENIYDLLETNPGRGQQRPKLKIGGSHADTYIKGIKNVFVTTGLEAYQILQFGLHNMSYASTNLNMHSSRAHCIFSMKLISGKNCQDYSVSTFNFCDLAGSERMKKTLNEGDRAKESSKINRSLSVLGRCIRSVRDMQKNNGDICSAPFRESKLTQLLQQPLQGRENICMIVNISPSLTMFDETQQALMFSTIAKEIVVQEVKPKEVQIQGPFKTFRQSIVRCSEGHDSSNDELLRIARNDIARLTLEMSEMKQNFEMTLEQESEHLRTNYDIIVGIKTRRLDEAEQQNEQMKKTISDLEREKFQLRYELQRVKKEQVIVLSDSDESDEEDEVISSKEILRSKIDNLERERQKLQNEVERLQRIVGDKESEVDNMKKTHDELKQLLKETEQSKADLRNKVAELETTLKDAVRDYNELEDNKSSFRATCFELSAKNCALEDENCILKQELNELRAFLLLQEEEIEKLEDSINEGNHICH